MNTLFIIALLASVATVAWLAGSTSTRSARPDWLAGAERALSRAADARTIVAALGLHVENGIDAHHVEWWHRDEDGSYRSRLGRVADADASVLDLWVAEGRTWRRDAGEVTVGPGADAARMLAAMSGELAVALSHHARPAGVLVVGARRDGRPYDDRHVADLEALGDHLVLVA